jgi:acyl dehydratase
MPSLPQRYFEDVEVGDFPPALQKGPLTTAHLMRWSAAMENFHKIHYDHPFAVEHDGLPGLLVNGSLKQQFILEFLKEFAGLQGWPWKCKFQFRAMDLVNSRLSVWGKVTRTFAETGAFGLIELELGIINSDGRDSTPGTALVALPFRAGNPVPYPFKPPVIDPWSQDH